MTFNQRTLNGAKQLTLDDFPPWQLSILVAIAGVFSATELSQSPITDSLLRGVPASPQRSAQQREAAEMNMISVVGICPWIKTNSYQGILSIFYLEISIPRPSKGVLFEGL